MFCFEMYLTSGFDLGFRLACVTKICHDGLHVKERMVICKLASQGSINGFLPQMLQVWLQTGCKNVSNIFSQCGINHSPVPL